ncbi:MAG: hypothetical protein V3V21_06075 [Thermoplasmata archaeon]
MADIIVCVREEDSEIAAIARLAGAQVLTPARRKSKCPVRPLLEAVAARNPDILVLNCGDTCDPNCIPRLLLPLENDGVDVVEAPWSGFRAFSRQALGVLRANKGDVELPTKGLRVKHLSKPPASRSLDSKGAQGIMTILGVVLLVMGLLLAAVVSFKLTEGVLYLDHALLSIGVIVVGLIVALAGRKLSALTEVADETPA